MDFSFIIIYSSFLEIMLRNHNQQLMLQRSLLQLLSRSSNKNLAGRSHLYLRSSLSKTVLILSP
jgi:hypothetical protein